MSDETITGSCLCGLVRFEITEQPLAFRYCACRSCQKTTGSAHASNLVVNISDLKWTLGEDLIRKFTQREDNPGFNTWFCSTCGSFLPHVSRSGECFVVPAGLLDTQLSFRPREIIYWEEAPVWYCSPDRLSKYASGLAD
ncbi:MAG: GFA family protein [Verrucomicrobiota bacterium]